MPLISPESIVLLVYIVVAAFLVISGGPLYSGKIPPNRFYGFRTERTLADSKAWYAVNRVAGGWMMVTGAITAAVATWVERAEYQVSTAAIINLVSFVIGMILMFCHSLLTLWRVK